MSIYLTGASGFIGNNLINKFYNDFKIIKHVRGSKFSINQNTVIHLAGKAHDLKNISNKDEYYKVNTELTKQIFHMIKNLQKVSGFLGSADKPTPISDNEIKRILGQVTESAVTQKTGISFEIGEKVKVCDGPFASFNGLIEEIDEEKSRLKVSVSIFGRATPVDLEFNQVEKN